MPKEVIEEEQNEEEVLSDKLDLMKFVADIKLRLNKDITTDFTLAKLGAKDKEAIIEMTSNAYFSKRLLMVLSRKSTKWVWDGKKKDYIKTLLSNEERKYIEKLSDMVFDSYMTRIYMTVVLNRNVDGNYLVNVMSGYKQEAEMDMDIDPEEAKQTLKKIMSNEEKKEKEK